MSLESFACIVQILTSCGLLAVAILSFVWVKKTFAQKESLEAARNIPHTAFRIEQMPQTLSGTILPDPDSTRWSRWLTNYNGRGFVDVVLPFQWITCYLTNLGPGLVTYAEVPYIVTISDPRPDGVNQNIAESFGGTFRFYNVVPGQSAHATHSLNPSMARVREAW
jgi:hypothetical protein